ncbi:hypothetical protein [Priestia aryabhattai]
MENILAEFIVENGISITLFLSKHVIGLIGYLVLCFSISMYLACKILEYIIKSIALKLKEITKQYNFKLFRNNKTSLVLKEKSKAI